MPTNSLPTSSDKNAKTLQQWKNTLANVSLAQKQSNYSLKFATSPAKFTSEEPKKLISPPSIPIDLDLFLRSIQKMKNQFNDLDRLLGNEKDMTVVPAVKK